MVKPRVRNLTSAVGLADVKHCFHRFLTSRRLSRHFELPARQQVWPNFLAVRVQELHWSTDSQFGLVGDPCQWASHGRCSQINAAAALSFRPKLRPLDKGFDTDSNDQLHHNMEAVGPNFGVAAQLRRQRLRRSGFVYRTEALSALVLVSQTASSE